MVDKVFSCEYIMGTIGPAMLLFLPFLCFGLEVSPESVALNINPFTKMYSAIDTVFLINRTTAAITVDSIFIRFLDGDPADFTMGHDCQTTQFYEYNFRGWVYGPTYRTLRYLRDSLFLLQDSAGKPVSLILPPHDSALFGLHVIVNCLICGRMPSFPKTSHYLYTFSVSGSPGAALPVTITTQTSINRRCQFSIEEGPGPCPKGPPFNALGQTLVHRNRSKTIALFGANWKALSISRQRRPPAP